MSELKKIFLNKSWLIIGKGPSFSKINDYELNNFYTFGLNHVIKEINHLDICHLIDFDVFEACQNDIYKKAKFLCLPINPHFNNRPTQCTIIDLIEKYPILHKLEKEQRLFWYNHIGDKFQNINNFKSIFYKDIKVKFFSAEAAFSILSLNDFKEIYSIGVDGGSEYSAKFSSSAKLPNGNSSLLSNGRKSFDIQFKEIAKTINDSNIIYSPLDADYPIKIYVGSQEEQMLSVKVLEYSIKKRTKAEVVVFPLHQSNIKYPIPKNPNNRQRTPFSFQRFLIPQLNNFKGKAIYLDSDMQVLQDIRQLWNMPMDDNDILTVKNKDGSNRVMQFSVMLMNCDKLNWSIKDIISMLDSGELNYDSLMKEMKVAKKSSDRINYGWNCLEWFQSNDSSLVHYTDMNIQPWVSTKNPIENIWMYDLINAIREGYITLSYIKDHIKKGWIRPSIMYQAENRILNSSNLPEEILDLDKNFIAPYKKIKGKNVNKLCKNQSSKVVEKELNKIFKSKLYRYILRNIPSIEKRLKKIKNNI